MDSPASEGIRPTDQQSRRQFLITVAGAGVMLGYARSGLPALPHLAPGAPRVSSPRELFEPTIWYAINPSGEVTVNIIRAEMGQHIGTAVARILAE